MTREQIEKRGMEVLEKLLGEIEGEDINDDLSIVRSRLSILDAARFACIAAFVQSGGDIFSIYTYE